MAVQDGDFVTAEGLARAVGRVTTFDAGSLSGYDAFSLLVFNYKEDESEPEPEPDPGPTPTPTPDPLIGPGTDFYTSARAGSSRPTYSLVLPTDGVAGRTFYAGTPYGGVVLSIKFTDDTLFVTPSSGWLCTSITGIKL